MFFEYIIGPVCAFALGATFTKRLHDSSTVKIEMLSAQVQLLKNELEIYNEEVPKKIIALQTPVVRALKEINTQIGLQ